MWLFTLYAVVDKQIVLAKIVAQLPRPARPLQRFLATGSISLVPNRGPSKWYLSVISNSGQLGYCTRIVFTILTNLFALGCSNRSLQGAQSDPALPQRGDRVLVESSAAQFFEARVMSAETTRLRVQSAPSGDTVFVQIADVYRLPFKAAQLAPNSLAICNIDHERWLGCRVITATASSVNVDDINEVSRELPWSKVLRPSALTELNLKRLFDKVSEQRDFERDMAKAGPPRVVPGWQPSSGKPVIAKVDGKWWLSVIVSEKHGHIRIRFSGTDRQLDVALGDVAPEPPYPIEVTQRSRIALLRPASVSQPWMAVRLLSVDALDALVEDVWRERRSVPVRDVCPLDNH